MYGWSLKISKYFKTSFFKFSLLVNNAFGLQFHVEQTSETVPQWACVPEYKSALEKTLGSNALEKFEKDVQENLHLFNNSAKIIYDNFKKII